MVLTCTLGTGEGSKGVKPKELLSNPWVVEGEALSMGDCKVIIMESLTGP